MDKKLKIIAEIAEKHMSIGTLNERKSDSLDFYDLGVWTVKSALLAAYEAGHKEALSELDRAPGGNRRHSDGPWHYEVSTNSDSYYSVLNGLGDQIAEVERWNLSGEEAEREAEANACLIAAAPDLLHALDYLLEQTIDQDLKYGIGLSEGEEDAQKMALAAIAKATTI